MKMFKKSVVVVILLWVLIGSIFSAQKTANKELAEEQEFAATVNKYVDIYEQGEDNPRYYEAGEYLARCFNRWTVDYYNGHYQKIDAPSRINTASIVFCYFVTVFLRLCIVTLAYIAIEYYRLNTEASDAA